MTQSSEKYNINKLYTKKKRVILRKGNVEDQSHDYLIISYRQ